MPIPPKLLSRVTTHFLGSKAKTAMWLTLPNPALKGWTPAQFAQIRGWRALGKMIDDALKEYDDERKESVKSGTTGVR